uniref:Uncharacterized protein n=1 Tax=Helianthus annuus TaxID=4232 RepID=A0A251V990_HELAN
MRLKRAEAPQGHSGSNLSIPRDKVNAITPGFKATLAGQRQTNADTQWASQCFLASLTP